MMIRMKYSLQTIRDIQKITATENDTINFLIDNGIIEKERKCEGCECMSKISPGTKKFRCTTHGCGKEKSCLTGTFFAGHRVKVNVILEIAYFWLSKASHKQIETYTGISDKTVTNFVHYFQDLVADTLDEIDLKIGGQDIIVELDETKLGKRKYNRGHRVEGVWILVGVERTPNRKVFMRIVENRTANTLTELIIRHVNAGSIIITDCWKGYIRLSDIGFQHETVNHSRTFKDEITGACTNTVEGTNNALKSSIMPRKRTKDCEDCLWEFIWRRKNIDHLWDSLLKALKEIVYE